MYAQLAAWRSSQRRPANAHAVHADATLEPGFWYVLDRAIAHRSGVVISGPPPRTVFVEVPRGTVLEAIYESIVWHRAHERRPSIPC